MDTLDFSKLIKRAWLILVAMAIGSVAGFLYVKGQAPSYKAEAKLLVGPGIDSPRPDLNVLRASGQIIQTYAELPLTEPFLTQIINELQLNLQPDQLAELISVRPSPETQILTIDVTYSNADEAKLIAYYIATNLVRLSPSNPGSSVAQTKAKMLDQVTELEQSVAQTRQSLQQMEADYTKGQAEERVQKDGAGSTEAVTNQLDQFEKSNNLYASAASQRDLGVKILEELVLNTNGRLLQFQTELQQTTNPITQKLLSEQIRLESAHLSDLRLTIAEITGPVEGVPLDQYILTTQQQVDQLQAEVAKTIYFDIRRLLFDQINQQQARLSQARGIEADRQTKILKQIASERGRISDVTLLRIENQRQILEEITAERNKLTDTQNTLALLYSNIQSADTNQVKIIELAKPIPLAPPLSLIVIIGALAGAVLAAVAVLGSSFLSRNVETSEQIARLVPVPVIDMDPGLWPLLRFFTKDKRHTDRLELYQRIGMRLLYPHTNGDHKVILVGSTDHHSDAGIVASNLAVFLAQSGKQILLVDANPDSPAITGYFGLDQGEEGWSDLLSGSVNKYEPITPVGQYPSLALLPFGKVSPDSIHLNPGQVITQLDRIKNHVDIVLVSVPRLLKPNSLALAAYANGVIMVVAKEKTSLKNLAEVIENLNLVGAKIVSAILKPPSGSREMVDLLDIRPSREPSAANVTDWLSSQPNLIPATNSSGEQYPTSVEQSQNHQGS